MLRELRRRRSTGLIMHKIDRSARNLKDWAIVSELPDKGIDVYIVSENIDFTTRGGRLTADMLAVIAADYIRNLREETKKGIRGRLKQGLYPFSAPLGYLDNGSGQPKTPCPVKAPLVREAFELYGTGERSLRNLLGEMTRRGLRNKYERPLTVNGLAAVLKNPFYTGVIAIQRTAETYQGAHEPIIPVSLFRRVQEIKSGRYRPKRTKHNYLFRGLFICGLCNKAMVAGLYKTHVYYCCQTRECKTKTVREDALEASIHATLKYHEITDADAAKIAAHWNSDIAQMANDNHRTSLRMRIARVEQNLNRASDLLVDGTLDKATYLTKKRDMDLTRAELQNELQNFPDPTALTANAAQFLELMKNLAELYRHLKLSEKRVFVENIFLNRTVIGRKPYFTTHPWVQKSQNIRSVTCGLPKQDANQIFLVPKEIQRLFTRYFGGPAKESTAPRDCE